MKAVIPMGIGLALTSDDNEVDAVLTSLRQAVTEGDHSRLERSRRPTPDDGHRARQGGRQPDAQITADQDG